MATVSDGLCEKPSLGLINNQAGISNFLFSACSKFAMESGEYFRKVHGGDGSEDMLSKGFQLRRLWGMEFYSKNWPLCLLLLFSFHVLQHATG